MTFTTFCIEFCKRFYGDEPDENSNDRLVIVCSPDSTFYKMLIQFKIAVLNGDKEKALELLRKIHNMLELPIPKSVLEGPKKIEIEGEVFKVWVT